MPDLFQPPTEQDQLRRLFELGYFDAAWQDVKNFLFDGKIVSQAREEYAAFHDVNEDEISTHILRPRCGLPDFVRDPQEASQSKWRILDVTTSNRLSGLNPLSAEMEQAAWLEAIAAWNAVCGLRMTYIEDMSTANIYANPGSTGAGVLAYSYLPNNSGPEDQMQQVYNRSTNWSYNLLLNVVIHEIGHAIGLDHGKNGSIMMPTASGLILRPQAEDIAEAQSRYGLPGPLPPPPTEELALRMRTRLTPGRYELESAAAGDYDLELTRDVAAGRYRVAGEFEG